MAHSCEVSKSALAAATAGYQLPTERVVREFVRVCGGDWTKWRQRWLQTAAELDAIADSGAPDRDVPAQASPETCGVPAPAAEGDQPAGGSPWRDPPRRRIWPIVVAALAFAVAGGWLLRTRLRKPLAAVRGVNTRQ
ncbi:hypothetical protein [Actinoallomurus sp. NPDC050550]|uniref:hypothetical protein n=1 Tax=Actinoallomurus sp. NPDC050550 TaxID=3154937 RepID=UPI0033C3269B